MTALLGDLFSEDVMPERLAHSEKVKRFSMVATSVPSQRLSSLAGNVINNRQSSLLPDNADISIRKLSLLEYFVIIHILDFCLYCGLYETFDNIFMVIS